MPNTGFNRFNFSTSLTHQLNEKLKITTKVMYSKMMSDNLPATGYNNQSISYFYDFPESLMWTWHGTVRYGDREKKE